MAGNVILLLYVLITADRIWQPGRQVVISAEQQQSIAASFERTWQRQASEPEMRELLDTYARREIAWREATRLGLGRNDADIRRRMQNLLETIAADEAVLEPPTLDQLQTFLSENGDDFRVDSLLTFRQIHFDNTNNEIGADASARFMLGRLRNQEMPEDISSLGDPSLLPAYIDEVRGIEISALFGPEFSATLSAGAVGEWIGPISSKLGLHIVFVSARVGGRIPDLSEIEDEVERKWRTTKIAAAIEELYRRLAENYRVTIE